MSAIKIVEQTSSKLNLEIRLGHWVVLGVLFGLPFLSAGLLISAAIGRYVTLECQRTTAQPAVSCQIRKLSILGSDVKPVPGILKSAEVRRAPNGNNIYTVVLQTERQRIQLTPEGADRADSQRSANAINQFLQSPNQLTLKTSQVTFGLWFGLIFTLVGGGLILFMLTYPLPYFCGFDRTTGEVLLKKYSVLLGHRQLLHQLSDIQQVVVDTLIQRGHKNYQLRLMLNNGEKISLSVATPYGRQELERLAETIREFLHQ